MAKRSIESVLKAALRGALVLGFTTAPLGALWAAELVDLRIGVHPDYTRVVFELDGPAGHKVERGKGPSELVVTLNADSIVRNLNSTKSLIESIKVEPTATGSKARVALAREGLSLKEMLLANPPRIVLDVVVPKTAGAGGQPLARPLLAVAKPSVSKPAVSKPSVAKPAVSKPLVAKRKPAAKIPAPKIQAKAPAPKPAQRIAAVSKPSKPVINLEAPHKAAPVSAPRAPSANAPRPGGGETTAGQMPARAKPKLSTKPGEDWPTPVSEPVEQAATAKQIFALVGLGAVVVAWFALRRRRGQVPVPARSQRETADPPAPADESNPFADADSPAQATSGLAAAGLEPPVVEPEPSLPVEAINLAGDDDDSEPALFGEAFEESSGETFGETNQALAESTLQELQASEGLPPKAEAPRVPVEAPAREPAGIDAYAAGREAGREAAQEAILLVRGLEERIASLQGRLEEAVDSRERIERQMAAQNEELRVQRAAIARTQRAVRNISRPEEENHRAPDSPTVD